MNRLAECTDVESQLAELQETISDLEGKVQNLTSKNEDLDANLFNCTKAKEELAGDFAVCTDHNTALNNSLAKAQSDVAECKKKLPVNCVVSNWGNWSSCSENCGGGTTTRNRTITTIARNGGSCNWPLEQTDTCNTGACGVDCVESWSESDCSVTCGTGSKTRTLTVTTLAQGNGAQCSGTNGHTEDEDCVLEDCKCRWAGDPCALWGPGTGFPTYQYEACRAKESPCAQTESGSGCNLIHRWCVKHDDPRSDETIRAT